MNDQFVFVREFFWSKIKLKCSLTVQPVVPCSTAATVASENSAINYSVMYCYYYSRPFIAGQTQ